MKTIKEWTTEELIDFLNSYNRYYKFDVSEDLVHQELYIEAFLELSIRHPLMALLY